ncbi:MAG: deoxyribonuclease IV [Candidatus Hodarchaeales archaeon]
MSREKNIGPRIGAHKSIVKGIDKAVDRGIESTCECLQIFTRPPRRWAAGKMSLSEEVVEKFLYKSKKAGYTDTSIHMPYLPNLASPETDLHNKSIVVLKEEIAKSTLLQVPYVISHLGSPKEESRQFAVKRVAEALNQALEIIKTPTMILLENSTSKKKKWGNSFEDISEIISFVDKQQYLGICFDTAHAFSSGYDISSSEGLHEVFDEIESLIGVEKVKVIHLNDSKAPLNSGIDHHEHIGKGSIGIECFTELMRSPRFKSFIMILETPIDANINDKTNLDLLRTLRGKS